MFLHYASVYMGKTGILIGVIPLAKSPAVPAQSDSKSVRTQPRAAKNLELTA
jgi:hypothetical protein